ncbi:hypothetical protein M408DRAFT_174037 [Serendipita vermifera MAFF 305830]|uniref:DUF6533 domain-containing protein n=1 Tax=Serendipita vermifera MAFF 305830 TaxID=933852 RepID=A0A0C2WLH3_SERVB|nr:hypothetical protein M408DRAFT_174037 [Serendipita vermifera MAFF 305830]
MSLVAPNVDIPALKTQIDSKRFSLAICAWVFYEMAITSDDSMNLFWMHKRWTVSKVLFFINRIAIMFTVVTITCLNIVNFDSDYHCLVATWAEFALSIIIISIVAFTLASRVYALWKGKYIVLTIFFLVLAANISNYLFIYGGALYKGTPLVSQPPFAGCAFVLKSNILWIVFANTLIFEAISISLIVYRAWPMARQRDVETPLFSLLLEDGVGYFLAFTASKLFTVGAMYVLTPISFVVLSSYPSVAVAALAVNRLFIRLQRATVIQPTTTEFNNNNFSIAKYYSSDDTSGSSVPRGIVTIGGTGRIRARRHHQDELFSDGSVELCTPGDVHVASTRRNSLATSVHAAEKMNTGLEPNQGQV